MLRQQDAGSQSRQGAQNAGVGQLLLSLCLRSNRSGLGVGGLCLCGSLNAMAADRSGGRRLIYGRTLACGVTGASPRSVASAVVSPWAASPPAGGTRRIPVGGGGKRGTSRRRA